MAGNEAKPHNSVVAVTDEIPRIELIDVEEITCSPAKKKTKLRTHNYGRRAARPGNQFCTMIA